MERGLTMANSVVRSEYIGVELTWQEIKKHFPNTWVGLDVIEYADSNNCNIKLAKVLYTGTSDEITTKQIQGLTNDSRYTGSVGLQIGAFFI